MLRAQPERSPTPTAKEADLFQKCTLAPTSMNSYQLSIIVIQSLLIPTNLASVLILVVQSVIETKR